MIHKAFNHPLAAKHLTHITFHSTGESGGIYPVMTLFFQAAGDVDNALQDMLFALPDSEFVLNGHGYKHEACHIGGPMPTPEPYLAHLHFSTSVFASPTRCMLFERLVGMGYLLQNEVFPLMSQFFGMVALRPKSERMLEPLAPLTQAEKQKIIALARAQ